MAGLTRRRLFRSFDHYFGALPGVRGFDDPWVPTLPGGRSVFFQPAPANPDGFELPFHYALADAFTICDVYHCSVTGPTWANRR